MGKRITIFILSVFVLTGFFEISYATHPHSTNFGHTKIIWSSNRVNANFDIWRMNTDGTVPERLTTDPGVDEHPQFKPPNDSEIVFVRDGEVWLMDPDGTNQRQCTTGGLDGHASYSPDGSKMVFTRKDTVTNNHQLWIANPDATLVSLCTGQAAYFPAVPDITDNVHPHFSPDGTIILISRDTNGDGIFGIYTIGYPIPGTPVAIRSEVDDSLPIAPASAPTWSHDGTKLVFARDAGPQDNRFEIWVMNSDGSGSMTQLTDPPNETPPSFNDVTPYYSTDSTEIDFVRNIGNLEIYKMNADGTGQTNLTNHPNHDTKVVESTCGCNPAGVLYDFGDAPDPVQPLNSPGRYPSVLLLSNGARHVDFTKEWLGISVDGENDSRQVNADLFDDGVVVKALIKPGAIIPIDVTARVAVKDPARYSIPNPPPFGPPDPTTLLYLNAWIDWNGDGDWIDAGEKIITKTIDPINDTEFAGGNSGVYSFNVIAPATLCGAWGGWQTGSPPSDCQIWARFRLDYSENVGAVQNLSGTLSEAIGEAKWGEVEDYELFPTLITLISFIATEVNGEVILDWETASEIDNAGFNIWRKEGQNGQYVKINNNLIPANGSPISGATYTYTDDTVTPGTTYYYRLEDIDTNGVSTFHNPTNGIIGVLAGSNSGTNSSSAGKGCFIATAAFGSYLDPHVYILRQFRDEYLLTNGPGTKFVELYYKYSPPIADFIAEHEILRTITRVLLFPLFVFGSFLVKTTLVQKVVSMVILLMMTVSFLAIKTRRRI